MSFDHELVVPGSHWKTSAANDRYPGQTNATQLRLLRRRQQPLLVVFENSRPSVITVQGSRNDWLRW